MLPSPAPTAGMRTSTLYSTVTRAPVTMRVPSLGDGTTLPAKDRFALTEVTLASRLALPVQVTKSGSIVSQVGEA